MLILHAYTRCVATDYKLELMSSYNSAVLDPSRFIMMSGLSFQKFLRGIHPGVLCLESVP